jgi:hypothetical protein
MRYNSLWWVVVQANNIRPQLPIYSRWELPMICLQCRRLQEPALVTQGHILLQGIIARSSSSSFTLIILPPINHKLMPTLVIPHNSNDNISSKQFSSSCSKRSSTWSTQQW